MRVVELHGLALAVDTSNRSLEPNAVAVSAMAENQAGCNRDCVPAGIGVLLGRDPVRVIRRHREYLAVGSRKAADKRLRRIRRALE